MEQDKAEMRQAAGRVKSVDDTARFLRELRQLRDGAGLGHAELAARAHYPYDSIRAAEVGPALPDLPVLSAFVRGCGGTTEEWEERWRSLTRTPSLPVAEARSAGNSLAAAAGARIGSVAQGADNPDPSVIIAALSRVAEGMASGSDEAPAPPADVSSWTDLPAGDPAALPPDAPAAFSPDDPAAFPADALAGYQPDAPDASPADALAGYQPDAPAASPADAPAGYQPDAPAAFSPDAGAFASAEASSDLQPDLPARSVFDAQAAPFAWPAAADSPGADDRLKGWDPIRMSSAWPALPDSPIDAALAAEVPPWETAPWAEDPSAAAARGGTAASAGWAKPPGTAQVGAHPAAGSAVSRAWIVAVAVVLICVLAVVLAIFA